MARPIIFGQIENIKEGYLFEGRKERNDAYKFS
jgi:hypothetical protein